MRTVLILLLVPALLPAQADPASQAFSAWVEEHRMADHKARSRSLFEASADWVAKWPDSQLAWRERRESLVTTGNRSAELWKQTGETLIRLNPPHTIASSIAYDWMAAGVNLKDAELLVTTEISWMDATTPPAKPEQPSPADLIHEANFAIRLLDPLATLASTQIQLKEFDRAQITIERLHNLLEGDFKKYFDQDPLEAFPDYHAKYFSLSARLAKAEGRNADALGLCRQVITNPYFHREYGGYVAESHALWKQTGGTEEGWATFSKVPPLPAGAPTGHTAFPLWVALNYKLPAMNAPGLDSRIWTTKNFEGKITLVRVWSASGGSSVVYLPAIQELYETIKDRQDIQVVTLSADDDQNKVAAVMKAKVYTFPVVVSKSYVEKLIPQMIPQRDWIVDGSASIRLDRVAHYIIGAEQDFVDEAVYKLTQLSAK